MTTTYEVRPSDQHVATTKDPRHGFSGMVWKLVDGDIESCVFRCDHEHESAEEANGCEIAQAVTGTLLKAAGADIGRGQQQKESPL